MAARIALITFATISALGALGVSGCTAVGAAFECGSDAQCALASAVGQCEASRYCSLPDPQCTSHRRYDESAGAGLAGTCTVADDHSGLPSSCPSFVGIACQDFEVAPHAPFGEYDDSGGTIALEAEHVYRGLLAGHSKTPSLAPSAPGAGQLNLPSLPKSSTLYARGFFYITSPPPKDFPIMAFEQSAMPYQYHGVRLLTDGTLDIADSVIGNGSQRHAFPMGRWTCVELSVQIAAEGQVKARIDDIDIPELSVSGNTVLTPPTDLFVAGIYFSATTPTPAWDFWMDEIAIATEPIGCTR